MVNMPELVQMQHLPTAMQRAAPHAFPAEVTCRAHHDHCVGEDIAGRRGAPAPDHFGRQPALRQGGRGKGSGNGLGRRWAVLRPTGSLARLI